MSPSFAQAIDQSKAHRGLFNPEVSYREFLMSRESLNMAWLAFLCAGLATIAGEQALFDAIRNLWFNDLQISHFECFSAADYDRGICADNADR